MTMNHAGNCLIDRAAVLMTNDAFILISSGGQQLIEARRPRRAGGVGVGRAGAARSAATALTLEEVSPAALNRLFGSRRLQPLFRQAHEQMHLYPAIATPDPTRSTT